VAIPGIPLGNPIPRKKAHKTLLQGRFRVEKGKILMMKNHLGRFEANRFVKIEQHGQFNHAPLLKS